MASRTIQRSGFGESIRVTLLEGDADEFEAILESVRDELRTNTRILVGILVSVTTAAILLAINIAVTAVTATGP